MTRRKTVAVAGGVVLVIAGVWLVFWPLAALWGGDDLTALAPKDRLAALTAIRNQLGAGFGGLVVAGGLYFTARRFSLDKDQQRTDTFSGGIDKLGADTELTRAGGVRVLERILHTSPTDRNRVLQSLTGFLRTHTPDADGDRDDIVAAVEAIRLREAPPRRHTEKPLDLRSVRLVQTDLHGIDLRGADLRGATLTESNLGACDLTEARLAGTTLTGAALPRANLAGTDLAKARLDRADLTDARLLDADLRDADLRNATLHGTNVTGASLLHADLTGTDLTRVVGLTSAQLARAKVNRRTRVPDGVEHPEPE